MADARLRPCPFCGGAARVTSAEFGDDGFVVGCSHNGAADPQMCGIAPQSTPFVSEVAAIEAWNERAGK